jgi:hypothetical protein
MQYSKASDDGDTRCGMGKGKVTAVHGGKEGINMNCKQNSIHSDINAQAGM